MLHSFLYLFTHRVVNHPINTDDQKISGGVAELI